MIRRVHTRRSLRNSLTALLAVGAIAACGLFAARPVPTPPDAPANAAMVAFATDAIEVPAHAVNDPLALVRSAAFPVAAQWAGETADIAPDGIEAVVDDAPPRAHRPHRSRQTLAMPYFSFAARS